MTMVAVPDDGGLLDVLAARYRVAFEKTKAGREQWIEGTLELAVVLAEARKQFKADQAFSRWVERSGLQYIGQTDRSALIGMAADLQATRQLLEQSNSWSWHHIWYERPNRPPPRKHSQRRVFRPAKPSTSTPPPPSNRRRGQSRIPDVMREENEGLQPYRRNEPVPKIERRVPVLKGLKPEQVDPDFKGTPLEFITQYGHVNLHTKEQIEQTKRQEVLSRGLGAVADHVRTGNVMLTALAEIDPATLEEWSRKPSKAAKLQAWCDDIQRAYETLRKLCKS